VLLLGSGPSWAGPPNPIASDANRNTAGGSNTATGVNARYNATYGNGNTASGVDALESNTDGNSNTASGAGALQNTPGDNNTAVGLNTGLSNTIGTGNTFIGYGADANAGIYTSGTALGYGAVPIASNSITLGNTFISAIYANVATITGISDRRRKKDIRALDADLGLDFIEKLQPVSYRFNNGGCGEPDRRFEGPERRSAPLDRRSQGAGHRRPVTACNRVPAQFQAAHPPPGRRPTGDGCDPCFQRKSQIFELDPVSPPA